MFGTKERAAAWQALDLPQLRADAAATLHRVQVAVTVMAVAVVALLLVVVGAVAHRG
jgi:hypothetical protein